MKNLKAKFITKSPETRLYNLPVPVVGLTGGIGTGKSTVARMFREKNIAVIDADKLVKSIYQKSETLEFINKHFPHVMDEGVIVFRKLREIVFVDHIAKKLIEEFIYALLPGEFKKAFAGLESPHFVVYDVPLLFEKKLDELVDLSLCVYAPRSVQLERLVKRDKSTPELAAKIIDSQMDVEEKKNRANMVIENTGSVEELRTAVEKILLEITV